MEWLDVGQLDDVDFLIFSLWVMLDVYFIFSSPRKTEIDPYNNHNDHNKYPDTHPSLKISIQQQRRSSILHIYIYIKSIIHYYGIER